MFDKRETQTNLWYLVKFMGVKKCFDWSDSNRDFPPETKKINLHSTAKHYTRRLKFNYCFPSVIAAMHKVATEFVHVDRIAPSKVLLSRL